MSFYSVDVSEHQGKAIDGSYDREWFIFRLCFDGNLDKQAATNLKRARIMRGSGAIKGFTGYVVPLSGMASNDRCMAALDVLGFPRDAPVMVDAEAWSSDSYAIKGDHSSQFNNLAARIRRRQGDDPEMAWAYGNRGPDLSVWPHKAPWLGWLVASYTSGDLIHPAEIPNPLIGQQYTNGQAIYDNSTRPSSTSPFGRCDHNILYRVPGATMPTATEIWQHPIDNTTKTQPTTAAEYLKAIKAEVDRLQTVQAAGIDYEKLAKAVAVELAARLKS